MEWGDILMILIGCGALAQLIKSLSGKQEAAPAGPTNQAQVGTKLNQRATSPRTAGIVLIWATLAFLLLGISGMTDSFLMSLTGIVWFGSLLVFVWLAIANVAHTSRQAMALRTLPTLPAPVAAAESIFDVRLKPIGKPLPTLDSNLLAVFDNQQLIKDHIGYLNEEETRAGEAMAAAIARYKADAAILEAQQLALTRMGHQANTIMAKIKADFPRIKAELMAVPEPPSVPELKAPPYMNSSEYERFSKALERGTTGGLARSGLAMTQGNWQTAAVMAAATVAMTAIQYQKAVRQMTDAHGTVDRFVRNASNRLTELRSIHATLRQRSEDLARQNSELHGLLEWFNNHQDQWQGKSELADTVREKVRQLSRHAQLHAMMARRKL
jgi:hypothetical protein